MGAAPKLIVGPDSDSTHWYTRSGESAYEVINAKGKTVPTTLAHARKLGLLWSVTRICGIPEKPQLNRWKTNNFAGALLQNDDALRRFLDGEIDARQVCAIAMQEADKATTQPRDMGTLIHGWLEEAVVSGSFHPDDPGYAQGVMSALEAHFPDAEWESEKAFGSPLGYGGKVDLHCRKYDGIVLDFKGKDFSPEEAERISPYDDHAMQLAAYRKGLDLPNARCYNLFFSRTHPGVTALWEWEEDELERGWRMFQHLLGFQIAKTGHDPSWEQE